MSDLFPSGSQDTVITGSYEELEEPAQSPDETYTLDGFHATRVFKVAWSDRHAFAQSLIGAANVTGTVFIVPARYPACPFATVREVNIKPLGASNGLSADGIIKYSHAIVTAQYATQSKDPTELVTESIESAAEFVTLPKSGLFWDAAKTMPLSDAEAPAKLVKMQTWKYTFNNLNFVPEIVWELHGTVNSVKCRSPFYGKTFEAETLLWDNPSETRAYLTNGQVRVGLTLNLVYKKTGWNKYFKAGQKDPQKLYGDDGLEFKPYELASFTPPLPEGI